MNNPFDENEQSKEHRFFKQMTDAINEWMLKQYPAFDEQLTTKMNSLKKLQDEIYLSFHKHKQNIIDEKENTKDYIISQINDYIKKVYPDMCDRVKNATESLEKTVTKHERNVKLIEEKLKKIVNSDALYEDVYKMRDEMKVLSKSVDDFTKKFKKVFS